MTNAPPTTRRLWKVLQLAPGYAALPPLHTLYEGPSEGSYCAVGSDVVHLSPNQRIVLEHDERNHTASYWLETRRAMDKDELVKGMQNLEETRWLS